MPSSDVNEDFMTRFGQDNPQTSVTMPNTNDELKELEGECIALKMELANSDSRHDYLKRELKVLKSNVRDSTIERSALMMNLAACQEQRDQYREKANAFEDYRAQSQSETRDLVATIVALRMEMVKMKYESKNSDTTEKKGTEDSSSLESIAELPLESRDIETSQINDCKARDKIEMKSRSIVAKDLKDWSMQTFGRKISMLDDFMDSVNNFNVDESLLEECDHDKRRLSNNSDCMDEPLGKISRIIKEENTRCRVQEQIDIIEQQEKTSDLFTLPQTDNCFQKQERESERMENNSANLRNSATILFSSFFRKNNQT